MLLHCGELDSCPYEIRKLLISNLADIWRKAMARYANCPKCGRGLSNANFLHDENAAPADRKVVLVCECGDLKEN